MNWICVSLYQSLVDIMSVWQILLLTALSSVFHSTDGSSCCRVKIVRDSENANMDGRYTYKETSNGKRDPRCMDGCVYVKDGVEENDFCFMEVNKETNVEDQCEIVSTKKPVMTTG